MLGPGFERVVHLFALTMGFATVGVLALAEAGVASLPLSRGLCWFVMLTMAGVHFTAAATPWSRVVAEKAGQAWFEAYPLAILVIIAPLPAFVAGSPVFAVMMLLTAVLGALAARRGTVFALAAIPALSVLLSLIRQTAPNTLVGLMFQFAIPLAVWITWSTARLHRMALAEQMRATQEADAHNRALTAVAAAARRVQVLHPQGVLQAVAELTEELGWSLCGVYVPAPDGVGHVLGGHAGIDAEIVGRRQPPVGVFGAVLRSGETVVFENYADHPEANPAYGHLGTAVGAPIFVQGAQRGALVVGRTGASQVNEPDVRIIELLADQAGRALEVAEQYERQEQSVRELERVNELKQDFLATVSHELRTPLAIVLGMAETLDGRWEMMPEVTRRDMTSRLRDNAGGLEHVIEALLDFSRLESGVVEPTCSNIGLIELTEQVLRRLETVTVHHLIDFDTSDAAHPGETYADPLLLERVIENLVTNACRHTPPGTRVRVVIRQDVDTTTFEVRDEGPGIRDEDLQRIGERFFRGGDPNTRPTRGLGLGLAFCREVLLMHDSELDIITAPGAGTSFRFALPRTRTRAGVRQPA